MPFFKTFALPQVMEQRHLPSLDGFRAIAVILVVIEHTWNNLILPFHGNYGVYIFFGISGFLITTLLLKEKLKTGTISLRNFYIRRFLRIFPVAYLYIAAMMVLNVVLDLHIPAGDFLNAALYIQNTSLIHPATHYFDHFWTLAIEEQFYLIFPFFIKQNLKTYMGMVVAFVLIAPIISYLVITQKVTSFAFQLLNEIIRYMPGLLIGSGVCILMFYGVIVVNKRIKFRSIIVLAMLMTAWILISQPWILISYSLSFTVAYVLIALMLILSLAPGDDFMYKLLNNKVMTTLGVYSYSIYMWQVPFTNHKPWAGMSPIANSSVVNLLVLAVVSYLSYNFYEKKFLLLKDKFR